MGGGLEKGIIRDVTPRPEWLNRLSCGVVAAVVLLLLLAAQSAVAGPAIGARGSGDAVFSLRAQPSAGGSLLGEVGRAVVWAGLWIVAIGLWVAVAGALALAFANTKVVSEQFGWIAAFLAWVFTPILALADKARTRPLEVVKLDKPHGEQLERIEQLAISLQPPSAPDGVRRMLAVAESDNPGLSITASISATDGLTYRIERKAGLEPGPAGALTFPSTEAGARGRKKVEDMVNRGVTVALEAGEFEWKRAIQLPQSRDDVVATLTLSPHPPEIVQPVRLVAIKDGKRVACVEFADFRIVRIGRKEIEILVSGRKLAAEFSYSAALPEQTTEERNLLRPLTSKFIGHLSRVRASVALQTIDLLDALSTGAILRMESLEFDDPIFEMAWSNFDLNCDIGAGRLFATSLAIVNAEFNLDIRVPESWTVGDMATAEVLARGISTGEATWKSEEPGELQIAVPAGMLSQLLDEIDAGKFVLLPITPPQEVVFTILDASIKVEDVDLFYAGVTTQKPTAELREDLKKQKRRPEENVQFSVKYVGIKHVFKRWLKAES